MSLINDALRRAKQAQQDSPSSNLPPATHFRPVEPNVQPVRHGVGIMLPIFLGVVALLALLLVWELSKRGQAPSQANNPLPVAARAIPADASTTVAAQPVVSPAPAPAIKPAEDKTTEPVANAPERAAVASAPATVSNTVIVAEPVATNRVAAAEPPPPPLKLQSIVYNPRRPSAMINGRVMFIGDHIRELKVAAIRSTEVILIGAGRTNLLSLEP